MADPRGRLSLWHGEQSGSVLARFGLQPVLSVPVHSNYANGRVFVVDKKNFTHGELVLASVVAMQIGILLDRMKVIEAAQHLATTEERLRFARDLHDGILQTLAGMTVQLETIRRLADRDPASLPARINEMQSWLLDEQREMRTLSVSCDRWAHGCAPARRPSTPKLPALVRALEQQWGATIVLPVERRTS